MSSEYSSQDLYVIFHKTSWSIDHVYTAKSDAETDFNAMKKNIRKQYIVMTLNDAVRECTENYACAASLDPDY